MIRKVVLGSTGIFAVVKAASPIENVAASAPTDTKKPPPMALKDLPIYTSPHADYGDYLETKLRQEKVSQVREVLSPAVKAVRQQIETVLDSKTAVSDTIKDNYTSLQSKTEWIFKYLREEENKGQRYGAVAIGGLTGFIFGLRGGFIRRVFYTGAATTAMGAICFPEETKEIIDNNSQTARQYINIAYNFLYGVKPGDPQLEVHFPELSLPKDMSEFITLLKSYGESLRKAISPPPVRDATENSPSDKKQ